MTTQPAGWYPDPFAAEPGATRYWDGERWTSQAQAPMPHPDAGRGGYGEAPAGQRGSAQATSGHPERPWQSSDRGAQGEQELASWGRRVGAYLLDVIPFIIVTMVLLSMLGVFDAMNTAVESGDAAAVEAASAMMAPLSTTGLTITIVNLLLVGAYNIGFHVRRGQTPGKMLVGIRVRMADEDRTPDVRAAGLRWLVQFGPSAFNGVALLGFVAGLFSFADHLWPLWDPRKQAIHDKAARTLVVRSR